MKGLKNTPKMITAVIIIGLLAIVLTLVAWFTPWSEATVETRSSVPAALNTPDFFASAESVAGSKMLPLPAGSVKVLNNGDEFVPDLLKEIKGAQHSITITNYIFVKGDLSNSIFEALTERAKAGVEVRVLMDGKGSLRRPKDKIEELEKAGGKTALFRPVWNWRTILRGNKRSHLRAMIIDGRVGYIGGFAFDDEWLGNGSKPAEWRDIMFKFEGQGARAIQDMFNDLWRQTDGEILAGSDFYPTLPPLTLSASCKESCFIPLFQSPTPDLEKNLYQFLWLSVSGAKDHIYLETPYLLPNNNVLSALKKKAAAGVDVEIIVPGPYVDSKIVQLASRSYYKEILDAGIHIYEYQPAHLHSKIMTADGQWSVVGSANLDNRSSTLNVEGIIGVEDRALAAEIEKQFNLDKAQSKEVTKDTFAVNITDRLFGQCSRVFAKQY